MSELEKHIYDTAMKALPEIRELIKKNTFEGSRVYIPFNCDGVFDLIVYNTETKMFEAIQYTKGRVDGVSFDLSEFSGSYAETETLTIPLNIKL